MSRLKQFLIAMVVIIGTCAGVVGLVHAQNIQARSDVSVEQRETVDGTFYGAGQNVDISGIVNGDVICAGQSIQVTGTVHGDVLCAGQTINISGVVDGSIRVAGQSVILTGTVNHNASVVGQTFTIDGSAKIAGDLSYVGRSAVINGSVGRDIAGTISNLDIKGTVSRNVTATVQQLKIGPFARLTGNVQYASNNNAQISNGAVVHHITRTSIKNHRRFSRLGFVFGIGLFGLIALLIAALFTSLCLVLVLPKTIHTLGVEAVRNFGWTLLTGIVASIVVPIIIFALTITVIGIPLAILLLFSWLVVMMMAWVVSSYFVGHLLLPKTKNPILVILLGTVILVVLIWIPILGVLAWLMAMWIGLGSILRVLKRHWASPSYNVGP